MQWGTLFRHGLCLIGSGHSKGTLSAVLYYGPLVGLWSTVRGLLSGALCSVAPSSTTKAHSTARASASAAAYRPRPRARRRRGNSASTRAARPRRCCRPVSPQTHRGHTAERPQRTVRLACRSAVQCGAGGVLACAHSHRRWPRLNLEMPSAHALCCHGAFGCRRLWYHGCCGYYRR